LERGDPTLIDKAFIKERFGEHAEYAELLAKAYLEDQVGAVNKQLQSAYDSVGGKGNWDSLSQVFSAKAPDYARAAARALAESGDIAGASKLVLETCKSLGVIPDLGNQIKGGTTSSDALDAAGLKSEMQKLREEAGFRSLQSRQFKDRYESLIARRAAGKRAGLN